MRKEISEQYLFESMPVHKAVATLAIPTIISQVVTMIYNLADTFFIGQIGDPEKGGEVVVETVLGKDPPFRLMLGSDAVKAAVDALESRLSEIHAWERVSRQTDFAKSQQ